MTVKKLLPYFDEVIKYQMVIQNFFKDNFFVFVLLIDLLNVKSSVISADLLTESTKIQKIFTY